MGRALQHAGFGSSRGRRSRRNTALALAPSRLTRYLALVASTFDNGLEHDAKLYYALNGAPRERKASVHPFKRWQGFLYSSTF